MFVCVPDTTLLVPQQRERKGGKEREKNIIYRMNQLECSGPHISLSFSLSFSFHLALLPSFSGCCCVLGYAVQIPPLCEIAVIEVMDHPRNRIREYSREKGQCALIESGNSISGLGFQDLLKIFTCGCPFTPEQLRKYITFN